VPSDDEGDDAEGHFLRPREDLESNLRDRRAHVRICAWCESVCVEGSWYPKSDLITLVWRLDARASHTICPDCFQRLVPGVPYPSDR
jgi:hypothetical protein